MSDELCKTDIINCAKLKEVTGQTPLSFRALFKNQHRKFDHCCSLVLNTNCITEFDNLDKPTVKRIIIIPCEKQFKDNPDLEHDACDCLGNSFKKQVKRDKNLASKLLSQDGRDAFFYIIYNSYVGIPEVPELVKVYTARNLWSSCSGTEFLESAGNPVVLIKRQKWRRMPLTVLYSAYTLWFDAVSKQDATLCKVSQRRFKEIMELRGYKIKRVSNCRNEIQGIMLNIPGLKTL